MLVVECDLMMIFCLGANACLNASCVLLCKKKQQ